MNTLYKLNEYAQRYNVKEFIFEDPIQFPHRYKNKCDIEISAFISAWLAYGSRKAFLQVLEKLHQDFIPSPHEYILNRTYLPYKDDFTSLYRFYKRNDFYVLCQTLNDIYTQSNDMEEDIAKTLQQNDFENVLAYFNRRFAAVNGIPKDTKSACKRLCMLLRWLIRNDGIVDLGLWHILSPSQLIVPVDTHVYQTACSLQITNRKIADMICAREITEYLRQIFPDDPCKGDFALYGYGINC
ncbi:MAG: TIGR02757 family protein [Bacteroidales bacterium]|jgi:uncharacterized protein (TIGR02757 family)|nr:TIGR02757 family protein [Bacteroidales bacterium]